MYKLVFYVPDAHLEKVKHAVFSEGAGRIGHYDSCCWQVPGTGQFRPLKGSTPYIGQTNQLETVSEYKVELVCQDDLISPVLQALKKAHPYEEPAFDIWKLEQID